MQSGIGHHNGASDDDPGNTSSLGSGVMTDHVVTFDGVPRAEAPGDLGKLAELGLTGGHMVKPDRRHSKKSDGSAVAWLTTGKDLRPLFARLVEAFPRTGLWPVVATGLGDIGRPWLSGELDDPRDPDGDAFDVLKRYGGHHITELAPAVDEIPPLDLAMPYPFTSLLVVPVARPADVPRQLRWLGACNRSMTGEDISAVLRSWEDRYGAVLVEMGFASMRVVAAAIPQDPDAFEALLIEHYVFDYDVVDQIIMSEERHRELVRQGKWEFWWD